MDYFNCQELARQIPIEPATLHAFLRRLEQEFPGDEMLMEIHLVRACLTVRDRLARAEEMLRNTSEAPSRRQAPLDGRPTPPGQEH
jgi:hypothetical protein